MSNPKPLGVAKAKASGDELAALRRFQALHGRRRAAELLGTSLHTLSTVASGGGVTPPALERIVGNMARAS